MGRGRRGSSTVIACVALVGATTCSAEVDRLSTSDASSGDPPTTGAGAAGAGGEGGGGLPPCHEPCIEQTSDVFDPNEVYVVGYIDDGGDIEHVLAHWSSPHVAVAGLTSPEYVVGP